MVFEQIFVFREIEINVNNVTFRNIFLYILLKAVKQLWFTRTADARYNFYVGGADDS